jgi:hypothetical protein
MRYITVVIRYKPESAIATISDLLAKANINIEGIDADNVGETGIIRLEVDRQEDSVMLLKQAGYDVVEENAIVVNIANKPGALATLSLKLKEHNIAIRSMRVLKCDDHWCSVAITTDEEARAKEVLSQALAS